MAQQVHLIFFDKAGKKLWYSGTDRSMRDHRWQTIPLADDDPKNSKPVLYEIAIVARRKFKEELGIETHFALEPCGEFVHEEMPEAPVEKEDRVPVAASLDDINFYKITPVRTPNGPRWVLRFDQPEFANQYISETTALDCLRKAEDRGLLQFATKLNMQPAQPAPQAQASRTPTWPPGARFRPGDLR